MNLVLLGAPGSGKGTQAEHLQEELHLKKVSSGDLFREHLQQQTELGRTAQKYMKEGELVPDEVTVEMLRERLSREDVSAGVVLDGFPRTLAQAAALDRMLERTGRHLDGVFHIRVSEEEIVRRLSGRLICRECGLSFHRIFNPFASCPSGRCRGQFLYQRSDDRPQTVRIRLHHYLQQTSPLIDHYRQRGLLLVVGGEGPVGEVTRRLLEAARQLENRRGAGARSADPA